MAKMAASSRFANVSDEEIAELNIRAVPTVSQRNMQQSMVLKFLKVRQPLWTY